MRLTILVAVACLGCGATDSAPANLAALDANARDALQGCSWRGGPVYDVVPQEPTQCYRVVCWLGARLTDHKLTDPCGAAELPDPFKLAPEHGQLWGYYDRAELDHFDVLRFEQTDCEAQ